jgi:hypothetical protein
MNGSVAAIRELSSDEILLVGGAWTWGDLGAAMGAGAITGAMAGSITGAGALVGALGGGLIGGAGYLVNDMLKYCF